MTIEATAPGGAGNDTAATTEAQAATTETTAAASASATTTETKAADTTLLGDSGEVTDKAVAVPADWPTDWRQKLAGEDKKLLERLGRMGSPIDLLKSYRALEQRVSSGDLKKALPEGATEDQVKEWRKENGVPDAPGGYKIELSNGLVLGETDKPIVKAFTESVHAKNWNEKQVNEALDWYYQEQERQQSERAERDHAFKQKSEDDLRAEFGPEFRPNINAVKNLLAGMPEGAADNLLTGRFKDGTVIGDNPGFIKWLASVSRDLNPAATLVPAGGGDLGKSVTDEIAGMEKMMGDRSSDYWRGSGAEAMQQRYRDLVDARDKMKSRAA